MVIEMLSRCGQISRARLETVDIRAGVMTPAKADG